MKTTSRRKKTGGDEIEEGFGPRDLLKTRLRMKLNQSEFGAKLGYRHPQIRISELENGKKPIPARIRMICEEVNRALTARFAGLKSSLRS